ncbi:hypothetical protein D3H65_22895 [Paraflavitalea soli]|uniref:DUF3575 domain-containing protein n=1 Tax=Paraflavitalea soli TaxID=2315862 RepID=A0A3B7MUI5_9BACT|nr:hypothetical protein [Paraflavitalea soli]AXY76666.1 hypothetical protein D3H65_22895 [Paraflavitalea soli]
MKTTVLLITVLFGSLLSFSQQSDFIVLKKWNNRTIKTFYAGSFISAETHNGFRINGFISDIRNDSIYIRQEETRLQGTEFGSQLDTVRFSIGIDYREIKRFNYTKNYKWGGKKGFVQVALPKIMMVAGVGYIILETVNTIYRKESFNDDGKLLTLGVAAGVAVAGYMWERIHDKSNKAGGKYKVVYIRAADLKKGF